jgi:hypothetical protein
MKDVVFSKRRVLPLARNGLSLQNAATAFRRRCSRAHHALLMPRPAAAAAQRPTARPARRRPHAPTIPLLPPQRTPRAALRPFLSPPQPPHLLATPVDADTSPPHSAGRPAAPPPPPPLAPPSSCLLPPLLRAAPGRPARRPRLARWEAAPRSAQRWRPTAPAVARAMRAARCEREGAALHSVLHAVRLTSAFQLG